MPLPLPTNDRTPHGDCFAVRQRLELPPPESGDSAELAEARRHLEQCPECQSVLRFRQHFDEQVAAICRDVPVPTDLQARIMLALDAAAATQTAPSEPQSTPSAPEISSTARSPEAARPRFRRRLWLASAAACAMIALGGLWHFAFRPTINLDQLVASAAGSDADQWPLLPEGAAPPPPSALNGRIVFDAPRQLAERHAAVYFFTLPASRARSAVRGRLVVVPASMLIRRPEATAFLAGSADYRHTGFCSFAWVEGDLAYVCLVQGGEDLLDQLRARPVAM